jgi:pSer/pThr/pTyr-binding forkhead associated (FHA) protein
MKKVLTIGRDYSCDIQLNDSTDVVSRNHAMIEIGFGGKYYIVDQSRNGTYVNGVRIASGQKVQVSRGDEVSFAHRAYLDWDIVPKDNTILYIVLAIAALVVIGVGTVVTINFIKDDGPTIEYVNGSHEYTFEVDGSQGDASQPADEPAEAPSKSKSKEKAGKKAKSTKKEKAAAEKSAETKPAEEAKVYDAIY